MRVVKFLPLLLVLTQVTGCGSGDFGDIDEFMAEVRSRPKGAIEPMPKEVVYKPFAYTAANLRSPFQPPVRLEMASKESGRTGVKPDLERVKQFLESFDIDTFDMVGTLENKKGTYALIKGSDGVHRVTVGDYMGRNHGKVVEITPDTIEVLEIVPDGENQWLERPKRLTLQESS